MATKIHRSEFIGRTLLVLFPKNDGKSLRSSLTVF